MAKAAIEGGEKIASDVRVKVYRSCRGLLKLGNVRHRDGCSEFGL